MGSDQFPIWKGKESSKWKKESKFPIWDWENSSNWKKGSKFPFWEKKRVQTGKKGQNFHFGKRKWVRNGKNSQNFHFGKEKRVQNGKKSPNFHFGINVWVHLSPTISYNKKPLNMQEVIRKSWFRRNRFCRIIKNLSSKMLPRFPVWFFFVSRTWQSVVF